jgi:Tectonin domain/Cysteine-rich secretory protein family
MNIPGIIATMVAMLVATMASAQSPNNAVWGVNAQNEVFRWQSYGDNFAPMLGRLKQVSVGTDGAVWGVSPANAVFRWTGFDWEPVPGQQLKQLSVRHAQEVWGVDAENHLFRWNGSAWEPIPPLKVAFVSAGGDGTVWGIGSEETGAVAISISVWVKEQRLIPMVSTGSRLNRIAVTDQNRVWVIDDNAQLFRSTTGGETDWQRVEGEYLDVAEAANGDVWKVTRDGGVISPRQELVKYGSFHLTQIAVGAASAMAPGLTVDQQQILDTHNRERQNYPGVGALQWSPELERFAQEWAQAVARGEKSGHRPDRQNNPFKPGESVGENMYAWGPPSRGVTGVNAVEWFISEKQWYHYDQDNGRGSLGEPPGCTAPPGQACGHFTQVIWKKTQYVGCGTAISADDKKWYVCNYYPPGNWNYEKPY